MPSLFLPNHPLFVHFPLALISAAFFLELLGLLFKRPALSDCARACLFLGTAGALAAVGSGLWGEGLVEPRPRALDALIDRHETLAFVTASLAVVLSMWRISLRKHYSGSRRGLFVVAMGALTGITFLTAHIGAMMVYEHGAAVTVGKRAFGSQPLPRESWPQAADSARVSGRAAQAR